VFVYILRGKAIPEMTYTVSGGTLNPTHSLTLLCYVKIAKFSNSACIYSVLHNDPLLVSVSILLPVFTNLCIKNSWQLQPICVPVAAVISNKLEGNLLVLLVRCCSHLIMRGESLPDVTLLIVLYVPNVWQHLEEFQMAIPSTSCLVAGLLPEGQFTS